MPRSVKIDMGIFLFTHFVILFTRYFKSVHDLDTTLPRLSTIKSDVLSHWLCLAVSLTKKNNHFPFLSTCLIYIPLRRE